ncbi:GNAT family N-acetyltransferase [Microbacterium sp. NPDC090281]|uniref:GNAT family N-acetyltransferase n=1 Tax=Microbacterium sp. NPDC090281 TaxID=3364208 RepID=UPI0037F64510
MQSFSFEKAVGAVIDEYAALAERSYGHPVRDLTDLREVADIRVALRSGSVVAGGLGLLVPQFFGGSPVLSACLGAGAVAPEERGDRLASRLAGERVQALQDQGAVISSMWTASTGYARFLGWEAPVGTLAWSVPAEALKRSFGADGSDHEIRFGLTEAGRELQRLMARRWNGPVDRPSWWIDWKRRKANLMYYEFVDQGETVGLLGCVCASTKFTAWSSLSKISGADLVK